ncbi:MAG: hypothetical protein IPH00_17930 [Flavobacteriales bacterium]|nr:hypothetical protein [Flavobacteriales bacterium]
MLKQHYPELLQARWSRWAMVALLAFNVAYGAEHADARYDTSGTMTAQDLWPIYHEAELAHWNGLNYWSLNRSCISGRICAPWGSSRTTG